MEQVRGVFLFAEAQDVILVLTGEAWFSGSHEADIVHDDDLLPCVVCCGECARRDVALAQDILNAPLQSVFGMNITVLESGTFGTVPQYLAVTIPLTLFTVWVMAALHRHRSHNQDSESGLWQTLKGSVQTLRQSIHDFRRRNKDVSDVV